MEYLCDVLGCKILIALAYCMVIGAQWLVCPILAVVHWVAHLTYTRQSQTNYCAPTTIQQARPTGILHPKTSRKYSVRQPYITHVSVSTQLLWSAALYVPAVLWHFSLAGSMPYSSSLLAAGVLTQCYATCMSSPVPSCQDCPNSY